MRSPITRNAYRPDGDVKDTVGASNARNPSLQPVRYVPDAPQGQRMSTKGIAQTTVPRCAALRLPRLTPCSMYHSSATLLPDGRIMLAGALSTADQADDAQAPIPRTT